jgi:hypothetical protein
MDDELQCRAAVDEAIGTAGGEARVTLKNPRYVMRKTSFKSHATPYTYTMRLAPFPIPS